MLQAARPSRRNRAGIPCTPTFQVTAAWRTVTWCLVGNSKIKNACSGARLLGCPVALPLASGSGARPQGRPPPAPQPRRPRGRATARSPVPSTPTTKRATASLDLLDLIKQKLVSLDTTHSLPLPATLAAAALSYSRGELVVRCIL